MESDNQLGNTNKEESTEPKVKYTKRNHPGLWKKGQSGNPKGRPKGVTMKEYAREWLARMTDEERDAFMDGMPKEIIWKMTEGNPANHTDLTSKGDKIIFMPQELLTKHNLQNDATDTSPVDNSEGQS